MTSPQSLMILAAFDENIHTEILALVLVSTAFAWQTSTVAILVIIITTIIKKLHQRI